MSLLCLVIYWMTVLRLKDDCGQVRKNAIMILTHLILNDMIKIRGQISAMALSLEDDDSSIKELSQVFFYELSLKVHIDKVDI